MHAKLHILEILAISLMCMCDFIIRKKSYFLKSELGKKSES